MSSTISSWTNNCKLSVKGEVLGKNGKIERGPIRLVSARCLDGYPAITDFEIADPSESMEDVYVKILKGEETGWKLNEVEIDFYDAVELRYNHPNGTEGGIYYIRLFLFDMIQLEFEVDRGDGMTPDRYSICVEPGKKCDDRDKRMDIEQGYYNPRFEEIRNEGAFRRTVEYDWRYKVYEIEETRF